MRKSVFGGFQPGPTQTRLYTATGDGFRFRKKRDFTICVLKTKGLISCGVTMQLIWAFVFANAKSRFSHDVAPMVQQLC